MRRLNRRRAVASTVIVIGALALFCAAIIAAGALGESLDPRYEAATFSIGFCLLIMLAAIIAAVRP